MPGVDPRVFLIDENERKSLSTSNEAKVLEEGKDDIPSFLTTGQDQHVCSQVNQSQCEHTFINEDLPLLAPTNVVRKE